MPEGRKLTVETALPLLLTTVIVWPRAAILNGFPEEIHRSCSSCSESFYLGFGRSGIVKNVVWVQSSKRPDKATY